MQITGFFCLLVVICAVLELYKRFFNSFLGFLAMVCALCLKFLNQISGFGCGFLVFGCSSQVFSFLELFLMFSLGIKVLQLGWHGKGLMQFLCDFRGKSSSLRNRVCLKNGECGSLSFLVSSNSSTKEIANSNGDVKAKEVLEEDNEEEECYDEDEEFDVMTLRKLVKIERQRANAANAELEKERMAAASAAEETMAMILRLQSEKSSIEMQANQYRRLAEQKQQYDQHVIRSLQWIVMKHESNRSLLEDQLRLCGQKLKPYMKGDEVDERDQGIDASMNLLNSTTKDGLDDVLISSLDMDSLM